MNGTVIQTTKLLIETTSKAGKACDSIEIERKDGVSKKESSIAFLT